MGTALRSGMLPLLKVLSLLEAGRCLVSIHFTGISEKNPFSFPCSLQYIRYLKGLTQQAQQDVADEGHLNPFRNHPTLCLLRNVYTVQKNEAFASNPYRIQAEKAMLVGGPRKHGPDPPWHQRRPAAQAWGTELMLCTVLAPCGERKT